MSTNTNQGIYKIINTVTDHFYIGSSVNLQRRKTRHFSELRNQRHSNARLQAAWNKYGEASFVFTAVEYVANSNDLYAAEDKWLNGHVGTSYCYNLGVAAASPMLGLSGELSPTWGYKHTEEAKAKISAASTGRIVSAETRAKRSAKLKGRVISEAQREQISKTLSGEGNYWYGKQRSDSFKEKIRKAVIASNPDGEETRYESIQALREDLGLTPPTVNRALKSEKPLVRGPFKGWKFRYDMV
jgi:group I intron endonuclease